MDFDVIVIGAGAAGMMCGCIAGQRGRRAVLIEHTPNLGEKIRISGGGRCNFTNIHCKPENFISKNPDFCRSALARYTPRDFIALVEKHGIAHHEKKLGQLFCDESSRRIIDMLRAECEANGVGCQMPCEVRAIEKTPERFLLKTDKGELRSASLVIATGGLSVPKLGASPFGYKVAEQFGLAIVTPRPGLVPLAFDTQELARYGDLSGVSVDALITCHGECFRENLLFTHRGLSGPAILQISSYWTPGEPIHIDLLPDRSAEAILFANRRSRALPATLLAETLPRRFAQQWCAAMGATQPIDQMSDKALRALADALHDWQVKPCGTSGYAKAEVTLGGVDTDELSSKTMEVKRVPGLYFIGEVVDVTGQLGGFNFQWAWASGFAAGQSV
ncbi:MAG TPA: NAD(P)/FAD-dependent oxidoreductase [Burkholderiales bacterium]|nr:NAD(P)/FAD-dependent oxidoreductase [Burkholderiales bacterium]